MRETAACFREASPLASRSDEITSLGDNEALQVRSFPYVCVYLKSLLSGQNEVVALHAAQDLAVQH